MTEFDQDIIRNGDKKLSAGDLKRSLLSLQICAGDVICVHSQIYSLGRMTVGKEKFLQLLVQVMQEIVGSSGTLIMPAFSYSFCNSEIFDVQNTLSKVGVLTEFFRKKDDVKRTLHPIFSFSVWGAGKEEYLDAGPDAFGMDSVYGKMIRDRGKILMLGADKGYTFYHLAEEHVNVGHRYFKNFSGWIKDEKGRCIICVCHTL